jgi:hypothetical protein
VQEQSGMISRWPVKGSIFKSIEWFWQYRLDHELTAGLAYLYLIPKITGEEELAKVCRSNWALRRFDYITDFAR